jgi:hypothetical protein
MNDILKKVTLVLAILLLICLLPMPYGYYTLIRFVSMVVFCCLAVSYYKEKNMTLTVIMGALALLFQPFMKIALGRGMWNVVDILVAAGLIYLWMKESKRIK